MTVIISTGHFVWSDGMSCWVFGVCDDGIIRKFNTQLIPSDILLELEEN